MNRRQVRIAIADDHHLFRDGLALLLGQDARIEVVAQAATSEGAVQMAMSMDPHVLLLDVELDDVAAESNVRRIRRQAPDVKIVVLTMHDDGVLERQLRAAGASDYLTKDASAPILLARIFNAFTRPNPAVTFTHQLSAGLLSERERQVLRMISQAQSNRSIGQSLSIAEGTVKRHVVNIFTKLGATSRIDAVRKGRLLGEV